MLGGGAWSRKEFEGRHFAPLFPPPVGAANKQLVANMF